jgi:endo-1,4-beta-xylanase
MKWAAVHPAPGRWRFAAADALVAFAGARGMRVRGHPLLWHEQLPAWVEALEASPAALRRALAGHVGRLVGRYRGRVAAWDVVNEAVTPEGALRPTVFRALGDGYLAEAFGLAHAADPGALLFYNDFGLETPGRKADRVHRLLEGLRAAGAPVHGVGLQMHLDAARPPDLRALQATVAGFAALGLAVEVTEMDVRVRGLGGPPAARLARQRAVYRDGLAACLAGARCRAVTFWGLTDRHSWIDARFGADDPLLFDRDYAEKPALEGVREALAGAPGPALRPGAAGGGR